MLLADHKLVLTNPKNFVDRIIQTWKHPVLLTRVALLHAGPRACLRTFVFQHIKACFRRCFLRAKVKLALAVQVLDAGVEGTEPRIFDVHRDLLVLVGVCRAENFPVFDLIYVQKPAFKLPLSAPEHEKLVVLTVCEAELHLTREQQRGDLFLCFH